MGKGNRSRNNKGHNSNQDKSQYVLFSVKFATAWLDEASIPMEKTEAFGTKYERLRTEFHLRNNTEMILLYKGASLKPTDTPDLIEYKLGDKIIIYTMPDPYTNKPPEATPINEVISSDVKSLTELGFSESWAKKALQTCKYNLEDAIDWALNHPEPEPAKAAPKADTSKFDALIKKGKEHNLSESEVKCLLEGACNGNIETAMELISTL